MVVTREATPADGVHPEDAAVTSHPKQAAPVPLGPVVLAGVAALAVVVGWCGSAAVGHRGWLGRVLAQGDVGILLGLVLLGFAVATAEARETPTYLHHLRVWGLRLLPGAWAVALFAYLFPLARGGEAPTLAFGTAATGTTIVPLSALARTVALVFPYVGTGSPGPVAHLWVVSAAGAFVLVAPPLVRFVARRPALAVGLLVAVSVVWRLTLVVTSNESVRLVTWFPAVLDALVMGILLAMVTGGAAAPRLRSALARPGATGVGVVVAVGAVLVAASVVSSTDPLGLADGRSVGARGLAQHLLLLVAAVALAAPILTGRGPDRRSVARPIAATVVGTSYAAYLWAPIVLGRWVSAPGLGPAGAEPARHVGALFHVGLAATLAWTLTVTLLVALVAWYALQRPWLRYIDRRIGWFVGGMWAIALASLASRLWAIGTVTSRDPGNGDPFYYHAQANMIADGVGFGEPIQWLTQGRFVPSAIHPPLFTLWLTPASLLGARGYLSHKTLAAVAGVLVVVVAGLLGRRLAGRRAGLLAAAAVALYPNLFIIDGTLWPEGLYTALVGVALLLAYRWRDEPSYRDAALIGGAVGLAVLARGEALLLLPLLCAPLVLSRARSGVPWVRHGLVMGVVAIGIVVPWTARNLMRFNETVPVSTNSEEVLYYANCDDTYDGPLIGYWSFNCQERARDERVADGLPADPPGDESERAAGWGALGRAYASEHRDRWPAVGLARLTRAWDLQHSQTTARALQFEGRPYEWSIRGLWAYRLALVPAIAGFVILRRRRVAIWPLLSMVAMVSVTAIAVYGHVRFRTVGDLIVMVAAAVAIDAVLPRRGAESPEPAAP